jgi:hypothetical protein
MGEWTHQLFALLDQMKCGAARGPRTKAGYLCKQLDEFFDFRTGNAFCHAPLLDDMLPERNRTLRLLS